VTHKVWLPRNGRREDPNVQADDVISYQREVGGDFVNPSGCLDGGQTAAHTRTRSAGSGTFIPSW
jgi:hypothetical protein